MRDFALPMSLLSSPLFGNALTISLWQMTFGVFHYSLTALQSPCNRCALRPHGKRRKCLTCETACNLPACALPFVYTRKPLTSKARWAVVGYCVRIIGAQRKLHARNVGGLNNPVLAQEEPKEYGSNEEYSQQGDDCNKCSIHRRCHSNNIL